MWMFSTSGDPLRSKVKVKLLKMSEVEYLENGTR